jgi:Zn-dependent peptidase ImmA (M78 family)
MIPLTTADEERLDQEANAFAMNLLMPSQLVRAEWERSSGHFCDRVEALAKVFDVEVPIMTVRLVQIRIITTRMS